MAVNHAIRKYDRTPHLKGSRLQPGDTTDGQIGIEEILRRYPDAAWIQEEKLDGANSGFSFSDDLELVLQCRGHALTGGAREAQFGPFKEWASMHEAEFMERLENRYIVYGEWTFAKHTSFYDRLPHLFHEFDVWDRECGAYLSTPARTRLLEGLPVVQVPVLSTAWPRSGREIRDSLTRSIYTSPDWRDALGEAAEAAGCDPARAIADSVSNDLAEGFYIKIEMEEHTVARFKWVNPEFHQTIIDSGSHWSKRPLIRNRLMDDADLNRRPSVAEPSPE